MSQRLRQRLGAELQAKQEELAALQRANEALRVQLAALLLRARVQAEVLAHRRAHSASGCAAHEALLARTRRSMQDAFDAAPAGGAPPGAGGWSGAPGAEGDQPPVCPALDALASSVLDTLRHLVPSEPLLLLRE